MLLIGGARQRTCEGITRRAFVQAGFMGGLGLSLPQQAVLAAAAPRPRACILLWLWGGPSHVDMWDPKPDAPLEYRGPYRTLPTNVPGMQVTELLPRLARRVDRYALVRSLSHGQADHGIAGAVAMTGHTPGGGLLYPHAGAIANRIRGGSPSLSSFVTIGDRLQQGHRLIQGEGGGMLGSVYDPFRMKYDPTEGVVLGEVKPPEKVDAGRVGRRRHLLDSIRDEGAGLSGREVQALDHSYDQAFSLMTSGDTRGIFDLSKEPEKLRTTYGRHSFGQSCLLARRLVGAGIPFVQVNWSTHVEAEEDAGDGGWDNHYRNFEMLQERQCWPLDQSCSALLDDLQQRGMLESTLVVAAGEFGRSPKINAMAGRDHWPQCYSALLAGGGVRGGQVIGSSDDRGEYPASRPVSPADLCQTMLEGIGITRTDVLALGLPVDGEPIHELF
jgi:hypothetical protein